MKRVLLIAIAVVLVSAATVRADIPLIPDQSLGMSALTNVCVKDNYLIGITRYGVAVHQYDTASGQFTYVNHLFLDYNDRTASDMKLYNDNNLLVINDFGTALHFVRLRDLPELTYLGKMEFDEPFADFELYRSSLYLSYWFEGIHRYQLWSYSQANFVDSSMKGILVTQLDIMDNTLLAVDEYNGILRYDLNSLDINADPFGEFIDYLFVPFEVESFNLLDTTVFMNLKNGRAYIADFSGQPRILDSLTKLPKYAEMHATDSQFIFLRNRTVYSYSRSTLEYVDSLRLADHRFTGTLFSAEDTTWLAVAEIYGGVGLITLDGDTLSVRQSLDRSEAVNDIEIIGDKLFVATLGAPIDAYQILDSTLITREYSLAGDSIQASLLIPSGSDLLAIDNHSRTMSLIALPGSADSNRVLWTVPLPERGISTARYLDAGPGGQPTYYLQSENAIDVFAGLPGAAPEHEAMLEPATRISTIVAYDNWLTLTESSGKIITLEVYPDYSGADIVSTISADNGLLDGVKVDSFVCLFGWLRMYPVNVSSPPAAALLPPVNLPLRMSGADSAGDFIFTVGLNGIGVLKRTDSLPEFIEFGGVEARMIAAGHDLVAISDGYGVHLYRYDIGDGKSDGQKSPDQAAFDFLAQNFPNPFNLETQISFELLQAGKVTLDIYNILGRRVRRLVDGLRPAGPNTVSWDGRNESGEAVATGVYFYRLQMGDRTQTRKMVLIK